MRLLAARATSITTIMPEGAANAREPEARRATRVCTFSYSRVVRSFVHDNIDLDAITALLLCVVLCVQWHCGVSLCLCLDAARCWLLVATSGGIYWSGEIAFAMLCVSVVWLLFIVINRAKYIYIPDCARHNKQIYLYMYIVNYTLYILYFRPLRKTVGVIQLIRFNPIHMQNHHPSRGDIIIVSPDKL